MNHSGGNFWLLIGMVVAALIMVSCMNWNLDDIDSRHAAYMEETFGE